MASIDSLDTVIEKLRALYHQMPWRGHICPNCDHGVPCDLGCADTEFYAIIQNLETLREQMLDCAEMISQQMDYIERAPKHDDGSVKMYVYDHLLDLDRDIRKTVSAETTDPSVSSSGSDDDL
jgi:hypothetical protein